MKKILYWLFLVIVSPQSGYSSLLSESVAPGVDKVDYIYDSKWYSTKDREYLSLEVLRRYLESQGKRVLLELGRLILAQDLPNEHNTKKNKLDVVEPYLLREDPEGLFGQRYVEDLKKCESIKKLAKHMFDAGHLGRYASLPYGRLEDAKVNSYTSRGMFNLIVPLTAKELTDDQEMLMESIPFNITSYKNNESIKVIYEPTETTLDPAYQIIQHIFSSRVESVLPSDSDGYPPFLSVIPNNGAGVMPSLFQLVKEEDGTERLVIDFSYKGDFISCLVPHMPIGIRSEVSPSGYHWESTLTNQLRLVLEMHLGRIRLVSLYPLDDMNSIPEGWKKVK